MRIKLLALAVAATLLLTWYRHLRIIRLPRSTMQEKRSR